MEVYLVEDCGYSPGRIYAVFAAEEDAILFAEGLNEPVQIIERTLWYGQPPNRGMNN